MSFLNPCDKVGVDKIEQNYSYYTKLGSPIFFTQKINNIRYIKIKHDK